MQGMRGPEEALPVRRISLIYFDRPVALGFHHLETSKMQKLSLLLCGAALAGASCGNPLLHAATTSARDGSASACANMDLGANASFNGFVPFASTDLWNTDISSAPVDRDSDSIISNSDFAGSALHHDWSANGNYGIPYVVVDSTTTPLVSINIFKYASESDVALEPIPIDAPIEGSPADCASWPTTPEGDAHVLVIDRHTCMLYETFSTHRCNGQWDAASQTIWDLTEFEHRPYGWTSADAAGLPIMPGLVRYDEVASGAIHHAIRFTMAHTRKESKGSLFVTPAVHGAGNSTTAHNIMGMRIRLKANFDISGFSPTNQVILTAMKQYGMILADNGSNFYFQGAPDPRWDDSDLAELKKVTASDFEVVKMSPSWPGWTESTAPKGPTPTINSFTASALIVNAGTAVTLRWSTTNDTYDFIDQVGGVSGGVVTVTPNATTTYTLYATNAHGRTSKSITITVN